MAHSTQKAQVQELRDIVYRNRKTIVIWPLVCLVLGTLYFVFSPRTYRSEARLFLRVGRESVGIDPAATAGQVMPMYTSDRKDEVKSAEALIQSRSVAAQVVDRLGPDVILDRGGGAGRASNNLVASLVRMPLDAVIGAIKSLDPISEREEAIIKVEKNLSVDAERQATLIAVQYKAATPQLAQKICQAVVDVAQEQHMRVHRSAESTPFFTEQQERLRMQLDAALEALRDEKNEMGMGTVEQRRSTLEAQYSAVELDRLQTQQQLATAKARIENLERQIAETPERQVTSQRSVPNQGADMLRDRLYDLQVRSMDLKARYNDSHPLVIAVEEQLKQAQKVLAEQAEQRSETTDEINPVHRELLISMKQEQSIAAGLTARLTQLDEQKQSVLAQIRAVNEQDLAIDQLKREAELARAKYVQYSQTMEEARVDKELLANLISNISVAQKATLAEKPVSPSRAFTLAGIVLFSVAGTVGLVLLREQLSAPTQPLWGGAATHERRRRKPRQRLDSKSNGHGRPEAVGAAPK